MAIRSFADKSTEDFFFTGKAGKNSGWAGTATAAKRKLDMLQYSTEIRDLRSPPGNRLESLKGALKGLLSIRINDQWRVVFRWTNGAAEDVRIVDYH